MTIHRSVPWLLAGIVFFLGTASARGQYPENNQIVFRDIFNLREFQPFTPLELSDLGLRTESRDGFFFNYQRAAWYITPPDVAPIGDPEAEDNPQSEIVEEIPNIDTSAFNDPAIWGNIFELGWRSGHHGLMARVLTGFKTTQTYNRTFVPITFRDPTNLAGLQFEPEFDFVTETIPVLGEQITFARDRNFNGVFGADGIDFGNYQERAIPFTDNTEILFFKLSDEDPAGARDGIPDTPNSGSAEILEFYPDIGFTGVDFGDATNLIYPINSPIFDSLRIDNTTNIDGVELMYIIRPGCHYPHRWVEFYAGARYFELEDIFGLSATSQQNVGFNNTRINQQAVNRLIGPQLGLRLFHSTGRWTINGEGRLLAAANLISLSQQGVIGEDFTGLAIAFANKFNDERIAVLGETQLNLDFRVTDAISLTVGYTGTFVGNIARASNSIIYQIPDMGIAPRVENVMMHGVNFGFEVAR